MDHTQNSHLYYGRISLTTLYFMLGIGVALPVILLLLFPQMARFFVSVLLGTGIGSIVSQAIMVALIIGLYVGIRVLLQLRLEYRAVTDIARYSKTQERLPLLERNRAVLLYALEHPLASVQESFIAQRFRLGDRVGAETPIVNPRLLRVRTLITVVEFLAGAMPLIGLIGTLVGLSVAVSGMNGIVDTLGNTAGLTRNIDVALSGMGSAFFTTLFGIAGMLFLRYVIVCIESAGDALMNTVEVFWHDHQN